MSRFLALWMPFFSTERLRRQTKAPPLPTHKLVLQAMRGPQHIVTAVDLHAHRAGITPGMTLAHTRACDPDLVAMTHHPEEDREALQHLAIWGLWMSPLVACDAPDGLFSDMTGCTHLFGGEEAFLDRLKRDLNAMGHQAFACISDNPAAARALARSGLSGAWAPAQEKAALRALPCRVLPIDTSLALNLERLGLAQIGACLDLPRAPLAKRFGADFLALLDQLTGARPMPLSFIQNRAAIHITRQLLEPIGTVEAIATLIDTLVYEACATLIARHEGARQIDFLCTRVDRTIQAVRVGTSEATSDPARLIRLLCDQIPQIEPGFGIEAVQLVIRQSDPTGPHEAALPGYGETRANWPAALLDRLANGPGARNLYRLHEISAAWPELAQIKTRIQSGIQLCPDPAEIGESPAPRPVILLETPLAIAVTSLLPDGAPRQFRLEDVLYQVACAEGPERLAGAWWQEASAYGTTRDYWMVETENGQRLWLYRSGDGVHDWTGSGAWHVQGVF